MTYVLHFFYPMASATAYGRRPQFVRAKLVYEYWKFFGFPVLECVLFICASLLNKKFCLVKPQTFYFEDTVS